MKQCEKERAEKKEEKEDNKTKNQNRIAKAQMLDDASQPQKPGQRSSRKNTIKQTDKQTKVKKCMKVILSSMIYAHNQVIRQRPQLG